MNRLRLKGLGSPLYADVLVLLLAVVVLVLVHVLVVRNDERSCTPEESPAEWSGVIDYSLGGVEVTTLGEFATLLAAGTQLGAASGAFGSGKGPDRDFWGRYWRGLEREDARWKDVTRRSIQLRVADAKAAGVHPLYALGASSPSFSGGGGIMPETGSTKGDVLRRAQVAAEAFERLGQLKVRSDIRKTDAETALLNSRRKREEQAQGTSPIGTVGFGPHTPAETWEQEYGGVVGETAGFLRWLRDQGKGKTKTYPAGTFQPYNQKRRRRASQGFVWDKGPCKGLTSTECRKKGYRF